MNEIDQREVITCNLDIIISKEIKRKDLSGIFNCIFFNFDCDKERRHQQHSDKVD